LYFIISATIPTGLLAAVWNMPMFSQASTDPTLEDINFKVINAIINNDPFGQRYIVFTKYFLV
jgi:hypothetical protein